MDTGLCTGPGEIARIVYQVLTAGEAFNGRFKNKPLCRTKQPQWPRLASPPAYWFRIVRGLGA